MLQIDVRHTIGQLQARFGNFMQERRTAVAIALTRTAQDVRRAEVDEMKRVFDRPTRFTLNSLFLDRATPQRLHAVVWLKESWPSKGQHYLRPQIHGGGRPVKRFEKLLQDKGLLPPGMYAVPAGGARLDAYGNMSRGQLTQILSQLGAYQETGSQHNRTGSTRSRRTVKRAGQYFVARPGNGRLPLGVWHKQGGTVKPVLLFVKAPRYEKRFRFYEVGQRVVRERFHGHLVATLAARRPTLRRAA